MSPDNISKSKENLQVILEEIEFPILYIEDNFIKEINLAAKKFLQFDVKKDSDLSFDQFCKTHHCSLIKLINNSQFSNTYEETYILNNEPHIIRWKITKLQNTNNNSHSNGYLIFGCDISKEKLAIEDLRKAELFYNNILSKLPTNVYWKDKDSVYMGCNDRLASSMGLPSRDSIRGMTDFDFDWEVEGAAESFIAFDQKVMRTKESLTTEDVFKEANGNLVTVLTNKTPLTDEKGKVIGVLAISVDITDKKKAEADLIKAKEKAEAASQAKSEFLLNMSHDVKTPLGGMISFSEILNSRVSSDLHDYTQDMLGAGKQLMRFFDNCMELCKFENFSIALSKDTFNLEQLLSDLLLLSRPAIKTKNLSLYIDYSPQIPAHLLGSRGALYRVLLNLIGNAIKFTKKGSIKISAVLGENSSSNKAIIKLTVADTGIGIPQDKQSLIFEKFSRLTPSYEGIYEGHGIGLYIVRQFVEAMEGEIHLTSEEGKGSQFTIVVPLQKSLLADSEYKHDENKIDLNLLQILSENNARSKKLKSVTSEKVNKSSKKIKTTSPSTGLNILVVEDNHWAGKAVKTILMDELGCHVDMAIDGKEAIKLFKPGKYDLIFMDIGLPDMKGYDVCKHFRATEKGTSFNVPILGLSAHASQGDEELSWEAGMNEMLIKPLMKSQAEAVFNRYNLEDKFISSEKINSVPEKENIVASKHALNVLVVEDHAFVRKAIKILLSEELACHVDTAGNGQEAIKLFEPGKYDLIFMDVNLSDIKGYEVCKRFRAAEKNTSFNTPIVGLSGDTSEENKELGQEAGMNEMLEKPLMSDHAKAVFERYDLSNKQNNQNVDPNLLKKGKSGFKIIDLEKSKTADDLTVQEEDVWNTLGEVIASFPEIETSVESSYKTLDTNKPDVETLIKTVHKFHGSVCYIPTPDLLHAVSTLETYLQKGKFDKDRLDALYKDFLDAMDILEKTYNSLQ